MAPNIIFVLLDGSRFDRLHISEKFSELSKEGFLLDNVTAAYPYTFSAMNAIFTGLFGKENGVDAYYKMFKLRDSIPFLRMQFLWSQRPPLFRRRLSRRISQE